MRLHTYVRTYRYVCMYIPLRVAHLYYLRTACDHYTDQHRAHIMEHPISRRIREAYPHLLHSVQHSVQQYVRTFSAAVVQQYVRTSCDTLSSCVHLGWLYFVNWLCTHICISNTLVCTHITIFSSPLSIDSHYIHTYIHTVSEAAEAAAVTTARDIDTRGSAGAHLNGTYTDIARRFE
jgi:hypothetical protein